MFVRSKSNNGDGNFIENNIISRNMDPNILKKNVKSAKSVNDLKRDFSEKENYAINMFKKNVFYQRSYSDQNYSCNGIHDNYSEDHLQTTFTTDDDLPSMKFDSDVDLGSYDSSASRDIPPVKPPPALIIPVFRFNSSPVKSTTSDTESNSFISNRVSDKSSSKRSKIECKNGSKRSRKSIKAPIISISQNFPEAKGSPYNEEKITNVNQQEDAKSLKYATSLSLSLVTPDEIDLQSIEPSLKKSKNILKQDIKRKAPPKLVTNDNKNANSMPLTPLEKAAEEYLRMAEEMKKEKQRLEEPKIRKSARNPVVKKPSSLPEKEEVHSAGTLEPSRSFIRKRHPRNLVKEEKPRDEAEIVVQPEGHNIPKSQNLFKKRVSLPPVKDDTLNDTSEKRQRKKTQPIVTFRSTNSGEYSYEYVEESSQRDLPKQSSNMVEGQDKKTKINLPQTKSSGGKLQFLNMVALTSSDSDEEVNNTSEFQLQTVFKESQSPRVQTDSIKYRASSSQLNNANKLSQKSLASDDFNVVLSSTKQPDFNPELTNDFIGSIVSPYYTKQRFIDGDSLLDAIPSHEKFIPTKPKTGYLLDTAHMLQDCEVEKLYRSEHSAHIETESVEDGCISTVNRLVQYMEPNIKDSSQRAQPMIDLDNQFDSLEHLNYIKQHELGKEFVQTNTSTQNLTETTDASDVFVKTKRSRNRKSSDFSDFINSDKQSTTINKNSWTRSTKQKYTNDQMIVDFSTEITSASSNLQNATKETKMKEDECKIYEEQKKFEDQHRLEECNRVEILNKQAEFQKHEDCVRQKVLQKQQNLHVFNNARKQKELCDQENTTIKEESKIQKEQRKTETQRTFEELKKKESSRKAMIPENDIFTVGIEETNNKFDENERVLLALPCESFAQVEKDYSISHTKADTDIEMFGILTIDSTSKSNVTIESEAKGQTTKNTKIDGNSATENTVLKKFSPNKCSSSDKIHSPSIQHNAEFIIDPDDMSMPEPLPTLASTMSLKEGTNAFRYDLYRDTHPTKTKQEILDNKKEPDISPFNNPNEPIQGWYRFQVDMVPEADDTYIDRKASQMYDLDKLMRNIRSS